MAITVLDLARFRGVTELSNSEFERVGLPLTGGCEVCGASMAAYNAAPARTGFLRCASGCIGIDGYASVEEANLDLFPEEYEWRGPGWPWTAP